MVSGSIFHITNVGRENVFGPKSERNGQNPSNDRLVLAAYSACPPTDLILFNYSFPRINFSKSSIRLLVTLHTSCCRSSLVAFISSNLLRHKDFSTSYTAKRQKFFTHFYTTAAAFNPTPASSSASSFVFPLIKYMYAACVTRKAEKHWKK